MSIQLDWEIVEEDDTNQPELAQLAPSAARPRPRGLRWLIMLVVAVALTVAGAAGYAVWTYRNQVAKIAREIRPVAKLEAQAVATNDRTSFMVLQDPDDSAWRALQEKRFGRLEREGWPELGWKATGALPYPNQVTLEPGGARLDMTYQFSITHPLPNGPTTIELNVPHYYKQMPSGWVHANPGAEYWGSWESRSGKLFAARYTRRDADVVVALIPRMDAMLARVCDSLRCPPQPIYVTFDNSPDALSRLSDLSDGFDDRSFMLSLPSPQLLGVPAGDDARAEFARMVGARIVQALVTETVNRRLNMSNFPPRLLLQWELATAGLSGPFITSETTRTLVSLLQAGTWPSLGNIPLRSRAGAVESAEDVALLSLAFTFLEQQFGPGAVEQLIPPMQRNMTLGEAISATWQVSADSLEPARVAYLRKQAGLPAVEARLPTGEVALWCTQSRNSYSIVRARADGYGLAQTIEGQNISRPVWSPDGTQLAYLQGRQVAVLDTTTQQTRLAATSSGFSSVGWLPDGRLVLSGATRANTRVLDLTTGVDAQITGTSHVWSPDGKRVASLGLASGRAPSNSPATQSNVRIWVADADGRENQPLALGFSPVWSPDSRRLAFQSALGYGPGVFISAGEIRVADVEDGSIRTLASAGDLVESVGDASWLGNMAWSPDGAWLAATINRPSGATIFVLDAGSGQVRVEWRGTAARWMSLAWSPDSRYVGFWTVPSSSRNVTTGIVGALNAATGQVATIVGRDFDWSPDSKWLAVPQEPLGILFVAPDLAAMRWLETLNCSGVAWRPAGRY